MKLISIFEVKKKYKKLTVNEMKNELLWLLEKEAKALRKILDACSAVSLSVFVCAFLVTAFFSSIFFANTPFNLVLLLSLSFSVSLSAFTRRASEHFVLHWLFDRVTISSEGLAETPGSKWSERFGSDVTFLRALWILTRSVRV